MNRKMKMNANSLKYKGLSNINVFTVTLNQVKVSLLNKSIIFNLTDPKLLNGTVCIYVKRHSTIFGLFGYKL